MNKRTRSGAPTRPIENSKNRLRELREAAGYNLQEFSLLLGVRPQSLCQYERYGKSSIGKKKIFLAAEILGIPAQTIEPYAGPLPSLQFHKK